MLSFLSRTVLFVGAMLFGTTLVFSARAMELPTGVSEITSVEGVAEYVLPNGLRILLAPDDSKPTTTVNMTYKVGSRHENYGQTGMAHLLEHLLFRGTPTLRNALAEFSKRGLAANGSTSSDRTNYYASFAADPDNLEWYLRWQADAMVNSLIAREDLDSEMTVVRNEMERGENNPFQVLLQRMQASAFQWHNYGKSTIGARSDVENVDIAQLQAFYRMYYQPDNAVLIVSGRFDPEKVLAIAGDAFGKIPKPDRRLPPEYTEEPVQDGERKVVLRRHGGSPLIAALFHAPASADPDFVALDMGVSILADTPSGRLYHELVGNGLSSSVFAFSSGQRQPGYAFFGAQLEEGMDQDKALSVMNDTISSVAKEPFKQEELDRMRNKWLTGWSRTYANPASLASALSESVGDGDWRLFFLQRDRVENVKLDDVQRVTAAYLVPSNRTNGMYVPGENPRRAPKPGSMDLDTMLHDYRGKDIGAAADAFDPTPGNIDAATDRGPLELANGQVKLALLSKPTRGDRVEAKLLVQFGNAESLKGMRDISETTASLLAHGTSTMTRQEIEDRYNALQAEVDFGGGAGVVAVNMSTIGENLPEVIKLSLHILREASFPAKELTEYQRQASTAIRNAMAEPGSLASRALARHDNPWPRDDVRYTPTFEEELASVAALTRGQLEQFHNRFYGAGTIAFSAVGQFDGAAVKAALSEGLKGWQKAPAYTRVPDPYHDVPPQEFLINTPDKANAFYLAALPLKLQDTDEDYAALYLANYLLGSSETSRLWTRVRVQDGLSYDVRSMLSASSFEPSGNWTFYAIHAPESTKRLREAMTAELDRAIKNGFTEEEVREGVSALLNFRKLARTRDGALATTWITYMQLDRSFEWSAHIDQALSKLSAESVNQAMRKRLDPARLSIAIAADQSKQ